MFDLRDFYARCPSFVTCNSGYKLNYEQQNRQIVAENVSVFILNVPINLVSHISINL